MICTKYDIQAKNCILRIQNDLPHNDNAMMYTKWKNEKIEYNKQKSAKIEISKNLKKNNDIHKIKQSKTTNTTCKTITRAKRDWIRMMYLGFCRDLGCQTGKVCVGTRPWPQPGGEDKKPEF